MGMGFSFRQGPRPRARHSLKQPRYVPKSEPSAPAWRQHVSLAPATSDSITSTNSTTSTNSITSTRSTDTMFDIEAYKANYLDTFMDQARNAAAITGSCRRGEKLSAEDLANGYIEGSDHKKTVERLNEKRIEHQRRFKDTYDSFVAATAGLADEALGIDIDKVAAVLPAIEAIGGNENDIKQLAQKYSDSYGVLRAIANVAEKNGLTIYGSSLNRALDNYAEVTRSFLTTGAADAAKAGVLGSNEYWEHKVSGGLGKIETAQQSINNIIGKTSETNEAVSMLESAFKAAEWNR